MRRGRSIRSVGVRGLHPLRVGATPVPHAEVLDFVRPRLIAHGVDLQIEVFDSFDEPNDLLVSGRLDANFFQYLPFLQHYTRRTGAQLVAVAPVHIEPFGLYAGPGSTVASVADIPEYAEVALPADPVNADRALRLLQDLQLVSLAPGPEPVSSADITANPRALILKEVSSWLLGGSRDQFDVVFLFGNQAMGLGLDLGADALHCERGNPEYAEWLVTRADLQRDRAVRALAAELNSDGVRDFLVETYRGQVTPAF
jgi:D-methionine transport system substrate-binding protein